MLTSLVVCIKMYILFLTSELYLHSIMAHEVQGQLLPNRTADLRENIQRYCGM
jgi:hypothetical protein